MFVEVCVTQMWIYYFTLPLKTRNDDVGDRDFVNTKNVILKTL